MKKTNPMIDRTEPPAEESIVKPSVADVENRALPIEETDEGQVGGAEIAAERFVSDGGCDSYQGTVKGNLGQLVFCQYLPGNRKPDTEVRPDGDGGWDHKFGGLKWDVKTAGRRQTNPSLTIDASKKLRADRYALVNRIGKRTFRLVGYAPRATVKKQGIKWSENGVYRRVERDKLVPFPDRLSE